MKCPTLQNSDSWKQRDLRSDYFLITCESFDLNVLKSKINAEMAQFTISYAVCILNEHFNQGIRISINIWFTFRRMMQATPLK